MIAIVVPEILSPPLETVGSIVEEGKDRGVDHMVFVVFVGLRPLSSWMTVVYVVYNFVMLSVT